MRYALILALALCAAVQALPQQTSAKRKIPCKTPENAATCYWTRGRLNFYNGNPSYRVWKVGTNRVLGVYSGPSRFPPRTRQDTENPELPGSVDNVFRPPDNSVFADFEVCPLEPQRKGEMQAVCLESARKIVVEDFKPKH